MMDGSFTSRQLAVYKSDNILIIGRNYSLHRTKNTIIYTVYIHVYIYLNKTNTTHLYSRTFLADT